jgi:predicted nucleic acid-binding Zn ribbon protein
VGQTLSRHFMVNKRKQGTSRNWSEMRSVLLRSLPDEIFSKGNQKEWLIYHWNLVVGKEIAEISTINKVSRGILHVRVEGKEWVPVLEPLKKKIMQEINSRAGEPLLNSIVFKAVA